MNSASLREKAVLASLGVLLMYAVAVVLWFLSQEKAWAKAARDYEKAKATYRSECRLIGEKQKWVDTYEAEKAQMPSYEAGVSTETKCADKVIELLKKYNISYSECSNEKEASNDDVYEMPVRVRCDAAFENFVKFMHEIENTEDGMFDIRSVSISPVNRGGVFTGYLKINFTIMCAYMRE